MSVKPVCDFCDKPLEYDGDRYVIYRTKQLDTRKVFPHLCRSCANKLDDIFLETKTRLVSSKEFEERVTDLYSQVNKARRERLGTNG